MKNIKKIMLSAVAVGTLGLSSLQGHSLWINSFESSFHKPGHAMVGIGFGHHLPMDEPAGKVGIEQFNIVDSDGKKIALELPAKKNDEIFKDANFKIDHGNSAMQMINFNDKTKEGTYALEAISKMKYITRYIDTKGNKRFKLKPASELKDIKKLMFSMKHQSFAKSYFSVGKWSEPKALGHTLEITPLTDLSKVKVGDMVEFEVLFKGKPLSASPAKSEFLTAESSSRGDLNPLFVNVQKGKAKLKVTHSGQWLLTIKHRVQKDVTISNAATLTFNVQ
jgi:uncharacterized GH25 family protein